MKLLVSFSKTSDNAIYTTEKLLQKLRVKFTSQSLKDLKTYPEYPSLVSISDFLNSYNIQNVTVKLSREDINEVPYPAIAHLHTNNGEFVLLVEHNLETITYYHWKLGKVVESIDSFEKKWTGFLLLASASEASKQPNFREDRKVEIFSLITKILTFGLSLTLIIPALVNITASIAILMLIKIFGLGISILLILRQFGINSSIGTMLCPVNKKTDCDIVIGSPHLKVFDFIYISELSLVYFLGGALSLVLGQLINIDVTPVLSFLNLLILPLIVLSIFLQAKVIKKWCTLCLIVAGIIIIEFVTILLSNYRWSITWNSGYLVALAYVSPLMIWFNFRRSVIESFRSKSYQADLNKFVKNEKIFQKLLSTQPVVNDIPFKHELVFGNSDAQICIILVLSPVCKPCFFAFEFLMDALNAFGDKMCIKLRFSMPQNAESVSYKFFNHIVQKIIADKKELTKEALLDWYQDASSKDLTTWIEKFPVSSTVNSEEVNQLLVAHSEWCHHAQIVGTPTIFINARKIPEEFSLLDSKFHIRKLLEGFN